MNLDRRSAMALSALVVAAVATMATSPVVETAVSTRADQQLTLDPSNPTADRHITVRLSPSDNAGLTIATVFIAWSQQGRPITLSVDRDGGGDLPLSSYATGTQYGDSFAPFPSCQSATSCEAGYTVHFRLVSGTTVYTSWSAGAELDTGQPPASGTTLRVTIDP
jgi:hypothetical protein